MDAHDPQRQNDLGDTGAVTASSQTQGSPVHVARSDADADTRRHGVAKRRRPRWRDAEQAVAQLTPCEREALMTLIRLPLAPIKLLEQVSGLRGGAAVYRRIARLRTMGPVAALRPSIQPRYSPGLLYVTDLGLATVAVSYQLDPTYLARRFRVRGSDLLGRLPGLPTSWPAIACWARSRWPGRSGRAFSPGSSRVVAASDARPRRHRPGWSCRRASRSPGVSGAQPICSSPILARATCGSIAPCCISSTR